MRIDLVLQRFHAGVQEQPLLLFKLDLQADAVPDLELGADDGDGGEIDQAFHPEFRTLETVSKAGEKADQLSVYEAKADNRHEKYDLPVEEAGLGEITADQTVNAEIDKR